MKTAGLTGRQARRENRLAGKHLTEWMGHDGTGPTLLKANTGRVPAQGRTLAGQDLLLASWQSVRVGGMLLSEDHPSVGLWVPTHRPSHGTGQVLHRLCIRLRIFISRQRGVAWRGGREGKARQRGKTVTVVYSSRLRKTVEHPQELQSTEIPRYMWLAAPPSQIAQ
jgi:hypothetical protein